MRTRVYLSVARGLSQRHLGDCHGECQFALQPCIYACSEADSGAENLRVNAAELLQIVKRNRLVELVHRRIA